MKDMTFPRVSSRRIRCTLAVGLGCLLLAPSSRAFQFADGDLTGSFDSTFSFGGLYRLSNPSPEFYGTTNSFHGVAGLIIGLIVGVFNIVPYLGTIVGLAVTLPLAFLQPEGGWRLVGLVLLVKIFVQAIEGWVLTPKIMGDRTGLHPITIIVAIFFWGTAFNGVLGMLLAIPLTAFFVTAWRLAKRKYFNVPA